MTTYRSEADFDGRFGRAVQADGRFSVVSYLDHQGGKLLDRFDPDTYRVLVRVMDGHDVGRGTAAASWRRSARSPAAGVGPHRHRHRGRHPLRPGPGPARSWTRRSPRAWTPPTASSSPPRATTRFLIEWDQLARLLGEALADGLARDRRGRW